MKAGEQEGAETELIHLVDYDLKPCEGCYPLVCRQTGNCIIHDDVDKLYEKVAEADAILIGAPFHGAMNPHAVIFMERVWMLDAGRNRRVSRNKVGGAIAVAGRYGSSAVLSPIVLGLMYGHMIIASPAVRVIAGYEKGAALKDARGISEARELGKSMVQIARATASLRGI